MALLLCNTTSTSRWGDDGALQYWSMLLLDLSLPSPLRITGAARRSCRLSWQRPLCFYSPPLSAPSSVALICCSLSDKDHVCTKPARDKGPALPYPGPAVLSPTFCTPLTRSLVRSNPRAGQSASPIQCCSHTHVSRNL